MKGSVVTPSGRGKCFSGPTGTKIVLSIALGFVIACGEDRPNTIAADSSSREAHRDPPTDEIVFVDRTEEVGIDFHHFNGMSGELYMAEIMGPGCALFDYDNDGDLDALILQGHMLGDKSLGEATFPPDAELPLRDRLFRSELIESRELRFVDATDAARIDSRSYGMGVAVGDYDSDGWVDLYITSLGPNLFLRNNGDGTFSDVTEQTGTGDDRWSASAAFVDYDADGHLDLFVNNYVDFTPATHKECFSNTGALDYCGPRSYGAYSDRLFRNRGDGSFEDVTAVSQIARKYGAGLGIVSGDFNADGRVDLYVANDAHPNRLWINRGDGTFTDEALVSGCAFDMVGGVESSMGVDAADFDGDGDDDLFMTHLNAETNTLYLNDGKGIFDDYSIETGLGVPSRNFTGFGTAFVDYDNDGWLDVIVANGAARVLFGLADIGDPHPVHQRNQLFKNSGDGHFEDVTDRAGEPFAISEVSRGMAIGDVDNDGDEDVLITNNNGPARLLINEVGNRNHWIGLRVIDATGIRDGIGARVEVVRKDGSSWWRSVRVASSYCSSHDPRVLVGLGEDPAVRAVRIHWPDGTVEEWTGPEIDRYTVLKRGSGREIGD